MDKRTRIIVSGLLVATLCLTIIAFCVIAGEHYGQGIVVGQAFIDDANDHYIKIPQTHLATGMVIELITLEKTPSPNIYNDGTIFTATVDEGGMYQFWVPPGKYLLNPVGKNTNTNSATILGPSASWFIVVQVQSNKVTLGPALLFSKPED